MMLLQAFALSATLGLAPTLSEPEPEPAADSRPVIGFEVSRKGEVIGRHEIVFSRAGELLRVEVRIDLAVTFLFFEAYSYEHSARALWQADRLVALETETDANGKRFRVRAEAAETGLRILEGADAGRTLEGPILATTYWHPDTRNARRLLNTQTGTVMEVPVEPTGETVSLPTPWGPVDARQYRVAAETPWSLYYDPQGCLVGIAFTGPDDTPITYRLTDFPDPARDPWIAETPVLKRYTDCAIQGRRQSVEIGESSKGSKR